MFLPKEKIKILLISDIHFSDDYIVAPKDPDNHKDYNSNIDKYIESFLSCLNKHDKIDYLILSGDIANDATVKAYDKFNNRVLSKIKAKFPGIVVITLPGNHDVQREKVFEAWCNTDLETKGKERKKNLQKNWKKGHMRVFKNYSNFSKDIAPSESNRFEISKSYQQYQTHGYIIDKKNKILFSIINSAWYSLGNDIDKHIREKNLMLYTNPEMLINFKNITSEFGNQYADNGLKEVLEKVKDSNDYLKIVIQHHPPQWLHISELYNKSGSDTLLTELYQKSQFLITGHEHLPIGVKTDKLYGKTHHLKAGMFLSHHLLRELPAYEKLSDKEKSSPNQKIPLDKNRFSMLTIDFDLCVLFEEKLEYSAKANKWSVEAPIKMPFEFHEKPLTEKESEYYKAHFKEVTPVVDCVKKRGKLFSIKNVEAYSSAIFSGYLSGKKGSIYLFPKIDALFQEGSNDILVSEIDKVLENSNLKKIVFVVPDIMAFPASEGHYMGNYDDRRLENEVYETQTIKKYSDYRYLLWDAEMHFNVFRHYYFNRVKLPPAAVEGFSFVIHLIPYWEI